MPAASARIPRSIATRGRLGIALGVSLLLHALLLAIEFGSPGLVSGAAGQLAARLLPPPVAPLLPEPVPPLEAQAVPVPPSSLSPPVRGLRLVDLPPATPAASAPQAVKPGKPSRAPRRVKAPRPRSPAVVTALAAQDSTFAVPLPELEAVEQAPDLPQETPAENETAGEPAIKDVLVKEVAPVLAAQPIGEPVVVPPLPDLDPAPEPEPQLARQVDEERLREQAEAELGEELARREAQEQALAAELARQQEQQREQEQQRQQEQARQEALARQQEQLRWQELEREQARAREAEVARQQELAREQARELARAQELAREQALARERELARQQGDRERERAQAQAPGPASGAGPAGQGSGAGLAGTGAGATPGGTQGTGSSAAPVASRAQQLLQGIRIPPERAPVRPPVQMGGLRRALDDGSERDVPLRMYIDSVRSKLERNAVLGGARFARDEVRIDALVSVVLRADGSVHDVTFVRSSGRADVDDAIRHLIRLNARYAAFPPNVAARFDEIEIRRFWRIGEGVRLLEARQ